MFYDHKSIEKKWQKYWKVNNTFQPDMKNAKKPFYNLMMFPYPSAEGLHIGNMYAFTGADIYGRFKKLQGYDLFEPIGLDGFGIHSENYAIKQKQHPATMAEITKKNFYRQLESTGNAYDWNNSLETYDPEYYKWTQWIFIQMYKKGLVERKEASVNWCPSCKTVLADEQVESGRCERCKTEVTKRNLAQWFFKITNYAEKLYLGLDKIDWSEKVKIAQKNWIGRSEGTLVKFEIVNNKLDTKDKNYLEVFTTRIDTIFGATYMVIAPEHKLLAEQKTWITNYKEVEEYQNQAKNKSDLERTDLAKDKTGIELKGIKAKNPANGKEIPIFIADYVLPHYGTGAIMAVPAHDERDYEFAKKYKLPIVEVIKSEESQKLPYIGEGEIINSDKFNGLDIKSAVREITKFVDGKTTIQYKLRDWLISRQRYWGPPIPMINCSKCGWFPEKEENLPVRLPETDDWHPKGDGSSPLANIPEFIETTCPKCGGKARRESDVSDTFLDSAWYFLRYPDAHNQKEIFNKDIINKWLPVDMYIGGAEHSVLHLLYVRFLTLVFNDMKLINFSDPFKQFRAHGLIIKDGDKMSKSRGNVINPDAYIEKYGADVLRMYLMFIGPFTEGGDFREGGIVGIKRFLEKVYKFVLDVKDKDASKQLYHFSIANITSDIENLRYNTAISKLMIYLNNALSNKMAVDKDVKQSLLIMLAPFAPHVSEELWEKMGNKTSIFSAIWPKAEKQIDNGTIQIPVVINGKKRALIDIESVDITREENVIKKVLAEKNVIKYINDKKIKKIIYIPRKIISIVL